MSKKSIQPIYLKWLNMLFLIQYYSILFFQMINESPWKKQNSLLEEEANNISTLKKQINKQSEIDATVQLQISQKIEHLKLNATTLAKKLQSEKHKNMELELIIKAIKSKMEKQRVEEATFKGDGNFESIPSLDNKYKKFEYDLGQFIGKFNRISENVEQKKSKIKQNRTERVIDSGIFRNIEKQLAQSELKFKKLLIEKINFEKEHDRLLVYYNKIKEEAEHRQHHKDSKRKSHILPQNPGNVQSQQQRQKDYPKKFTNIDAGKDIQNARTMTMKFIEQENEFQEQQRVIKIQKLLCETGLQNSNQLVYNFFHIDEVNDKLFNEMNLFSDQSNEIQRYLDDINFLKEKKAIHFYQAKKDPSKGKVIQNECKRFKQAIVKLEGTIQRETSEISNLFRESNFSTFLKMLQIEENKQIETDYNVDAFIDILQALEEKVQTFLSHPHIVHEDKIITPRSNIPQKLSNSQERLEELINKIKKTDENYKVMKKQDFKEQYLKIVQQKKPVKAISKRKSNSNLKR